jgi:hypothetical protein
MCKTLNAEKSKTEKLKFFSISAFQHFSLSAFQLVSLLAAFQFVSISAFAVTNPNPYDGIVERNVFDIHPVVAPPPGSEKPPGPPPPLIKLNGITDILGKKQVLLKAMMPGKPPAGPKEEAMVLTEGQREGDIEVISIDVKAGTVVVNDFGVVTNLSLEANAEKLNSTGPVPGAAPAPRGLPVPGGVPGAPAMPQPTMPGRLPQRTLRLPGQSQINPTAPAVSPTYGEMTPYGPSPVSQQPQNHLPYTFNNSDEQALMIEAQRLKYQQEGNPLAGALPPTDIPSPSRPSKALPQ